MKLRWVERQLERAQARATLAARPEGKGLNDVVQGPAPAGVQGTDGAAEPDAAHAPMVNALAAFLAVVAKGSWGKGKGKGGGGDKGGGGKGGGGTQVPKQLSAGMLALWGRVAPPLRVPEVHRGAREAARGGQGCRGRGVHELGAEPAAVPTADDALWETAQWFLTNPEDGLGSPAAPALGEVRASNRFAALAADDDASASYPMPPAAPCGGPAPAGNLHGNRGSVWRAGVIRRLPR